MSTDVILQTRTRLRNDDEVEFLAIYAPEEYERNIDNILAAQEEEEGIEDLGLQNDEQDLMLLGATWRRRFGEDGEWVDRLYFRESDKRSAEGEAYPDLVPIGTPAAQVPVRERLLTVTEKESELGWRSDVTLGNRFGRFAAGLHEHHHQPRQPPVPPQPPHPPPSMCPLISVLSERQLCWDL